MVSLKKKTIKGHNYWYAVEMSRVNGKPKQTWQMYLGTAEKIIEAIKGSAGKPYAKIKSFQYGKIAALLQINEELKFVGSHGLINPHFLYSGNSRINSPARIFLTTWVTWTRM